MQRVEESRDACPLMGRQSKGLMMEDTALDCEANTAFEPAVGRNLVCPRLDAACGCDIRSDVRSQW